MEALDETNKTLYSDSKQEHPKHDYQAYDDYPNKKQNIIRIDEKANEFDQNDKKATSNK